MTDEKPRFVADNNVGRLARWLRVLGYDTLLFDDRDDNEIISLALGGGRVVLTRDRGMLMRRVVTSGRLKAVLLESENPAEQLKTIVGRLHLTGDDAFSLCVECNRPLVPVNKEDVYDDVPPHVYETQRSYMKCPSCRRVYWRGSHWEYMNGRLQSILKTDGGDEEQRSG